MHEVLVNRLGGLSLPRESVVRLNDRPDMTLDGCRGRKTAMQQQQQIDADQEIPTLGSTDNYSFTLGLGFRGLHRRPMTILFIS